MAGERLNNDEHENQWEKTEFDAYDPERAKQQREADRVPVEKIADQPEDIPAEQSTSKFETPFAQTYEDRRQDAFEAWQRMEGKHFRPDQLQDLQKVFDAAETAAPILQTQEFDYHQLNPKRDQICREAAYNRASSTHELGDSTAREFNDFYLKTAQHANRDKIPFFNALTSELRTYPYKDKDDFLPIDAMNNYVDTFVAYQTSKEPNLEVGLAKGLILRRDMVLETAVHPVDGNPAADGIVIDNIFLKPYLAEFVQSNSKVTNPEKLDDFLQQKVVELESAARVAKRHGRKADQFGQHRIDAINRSLREINDLRETYADDLEEINSAEAAAD